MDEQVMQIAIIGAGNVGAALGKGWSRAGHTICYGVTDSADDKHRAAADEAGGAKLTEVSEAVADANVVVLAVPWDAVEAVVSACGDLLGRVVIDVTNPLRMGPEGLGLAIGFDNLGGETVARLAVGASVFKTINQVGYQVMSDTTGYPNRPAMFVAGDASDRKPAVMSLIEDLGFEAIDAGPLKLARLLEPYAMLWIHMAMNQKTPLDNAFAFMRREQWLAFD